MLLALLYYLPTHQRNISCHDIFLQFWHMTSMHINVFIYVFFKISQAYTVCENFESTCSPVEARGTKVTKVLWSLSKPFLHPLELIKSYFVPHINLVNAEEYHDCSLFLPFKPVEPDIYSTSINIFSIDLLSLLFWRKLYSTHIVIIRITTTKRYH